ncbi:MAG TPA: flagellin, partial [Bryobacteraceae bacterium]|nr:flagellin [Bryobacteraceae bacterium]
GTPSAEALKRANIAAEIHTGTDGHEQLLFTSANSAFQVTAADQTANAFLGNFTTNANGNAAASDATGAGVGLSAAFDASGTQQYTAAYLPLTGDTTSPDTQTLTFSANDTNGVQQTVPVTITAGTNGSVSAAAACLVINAALQASDNPALQSIIATTDPTGANITFSNSSTSPFSLTIGAQTGVDAGAGLANPNTIQKSHNVGVGSTVDISSQSTAEQAVTALASAVSRLGDAQAVVGKGENQFNYAINLAQSQVTNLAAAESQIRDADLAAESANLTKAQILIQAGVAALAQANSAPQQVLTLLQK